MKTFIEPKSLMRLSPYLPPKLSRHLVTLQEGGDFSATTCGGTWRSLQPVSSRESDEAVEAKPSTGVILWYLKMVLQGDERKSDEANAKALP